MGNQVGLEPGVLPPDRGWQTFHWLPATSRSGCPEPWAKKDPEAMFGPSGKGHWG